MRIYTPVVVQKAKADTHERKHEVQTEEVAFDQLCTAICHTRAPDAAHLNLCATPEKMQWDAETGRPRKVKQIVKGHRERNHDRLRDLGSVDPSEDIDAICREGGEKRHVQVVQRTYTTHASEELPRGTKKSRTEIQEGAKEWSEGDGDYNVSVSIVGIVNHQQRN